MNTLTLKVIEALAEVIESLSNSVEMQDIEEFLNDIRKEKSNGYSKKN